MPQAWNLFQEAKTWGVRPSELLRIDDEYAAYCLDQAIAAWGNYIVDQLESIEESNPKKLATKQRNKLAQLLQVPAQQRFRSVPRPPKPPPKE